MDRELKPWTMGFMGALPNDICRWINSAIPENVTSVCVPFLGSAKAMSLFVKPNRTVETWDTQFLLKCLVDGVWKQKEACIQIGAPKLQKGYMFNERPFGEMPDRAAGLIDYIAAHSSLYEKVALATAVIRHTVRGRLGEWAKSGTAESIWASYQRRIEYQKDFLDLPGNLVFHEDNFYDADLVDKHYDYMYIDPPKIVTNTDAYSGTFARLNFAIGATPEELVSFDRWTRYDYIGRMRKMIEGVSSDYIVFIYTSDVRPNLQELQSMLRDYGEIQEEVRIKHGGRVDYGMHIERHH